jgi:hypothetical protein
MPCFSFTFKILTSVKHVYHRDMGQQRFDNLSKRKTLTVNKRCLFSIIIPRLSPLSQKSVHISRLRVDYENYENINKNNNIKDCLFIIRVSITAAIWIYISLRYHSFVNLCFSKITNIYFFLPSSLSFLYCFFPFTIVFTFSF